MGLNIKNAEAEHLARELAEVTGETITEAVTIAVRDRLEHVRDRSSTVARRAASLRAIAADASGRWLEEQRTGDLARFLYDERGLPR
jgi:antitoxin VapB